MVSVQAGRSFALALFAALVVAAPSQAAFPGTNGKIAYTRCGSVECAIWTMNSDGTNAARLTPTGERDETPAFSADGRRLVFHRTPDEDSSGIALATPDLNGETLVTTEPADRSFQDSSPAFSPDGKTIAFSRTTFSTLNDTIWSVSSSGGEPKQLTTEGSSFPFDQSPVFSPDGSKIAFVAATFGVIGLVGEIDLVDADGNNRVTFSPSGSGQPDFSPDGSKLVFSHCCDANHNSQIVTAPITDGSTMTPITSPDATHSDGDPSVSPDGTRVAFVRTEVATGRSVIASVPIDGGEVTTLTRLGGNGSPAWQAAVPSDATPTPTVVTQPAPGGNLKLRAVGAVLSRRTIAIKNGTARLTLKCPSDAQLHCAGTVTLTANLKRHGRATTIGETRFLIQPGKNAQLKVRLSAAAKRALRHGARLKPIAAISG